jgi:hypothetical protein
VHCCTTHNTATQLPAVYAIPSSSCADLSNRVTQARHCDRLSPPSPGARLRAENVQGTQKKPQQGGTHCSTVATTVTHTRAHTTQSYCNAPCTHRNWGPNGCVQPRRRAASPCWWLVLRLSSVTNTHGPAAWLTESKHGKTATCCCQGLSTS